MDFLYGKLCQYIEEKEYSGQTTDTAKVTVDNNSSSIRVDVFIEDSLSEISKKPIQSAAVYEALRDLSSKIPPKIECDTNLSTKSDNPVVNKAIATSIYSVIKMLSDFGLITITTDNIDDIFSDNDDNSFIIQDDITIDELLSLISEKVSCSSIARSYDNSAEYYAGDYVTYNTKLYECIKETGEQDDFNLTNWREVCLFDLLKNGSEYFSIGSDNAGKPFIIDISDLLLDDTVSISQLKYNSILNAIKSNQLIYVKTSDGVYSSIIESDGDIHPYNSVKPAISISSVPTLASSTSWYKGTTAKSAITSISLMDEYSPNGHELECWNADVNNSGKIKCYVVNDNKLIIAGNGTGKIFAHPNSNGIFAYFSSITEVNNLALMDFSKATLLASAFIDCAQLTHLDVSTFNTSKVTNMQYMFSGCRSLLSGYDELSVDKIQNPNNYILDVSNWDTSLVTNMRYMFNGCISLAELDVSNWDVSNVKDMGCMFQASGGNGSHDIRGNIVKLPVTNWRPRKCENFGWWCWGQRSLREADISKWEVGYEVTKPVIDLDHFFSHCRNLNTQTFDSWDFSKVINFDAMLNDTRSFKSINGKPAYDVTGWDVSNAQCLAQLFENYNSNSPGIIKGIDSWKTSSLTNMGQLFRSYFALEEVDLSNFDTRHLIDIIWDNTGRGGRAGFDQAFGSLDTISYYRTKDTSLNAYKVYYTASSNGAGGYVFDPVTNPNASSISTYFEAIPIEYPRLLQKITFGVNFDFRGAEFHGGDKLTGSSIFKFPKPSNYHIPGATGQWYWVNHPDTMTDEEATYSDVDLKGYFKAEDLPNPAVVGQEVVLVAVGSKYDTRS